MRRLLAPFVVSCLLPAALLVAPGAAQDAAPAATPEPGFAALFDGTQESFAAWEVAGADGFELVDGAIAAAAADDLGLLWYAERPFADFVLRLEFRVAQPDDNSGVFVRFRDPAAPLTAAEAADPDAFPMRDLYGENGAWVAVDTGFEVQIDEAALGDPMDEGDDGQERFKTGALYDLPVGEGPGEQRFAAGPAVVPGEWHGLEVEVVGDAYAVRIDGREVSAYTNPDPLRGRGADENPASGFIGLQSHPFTAGRVEFRDIRIRELPTGDAAATPVA